MVEKTDKELVAAAKLNPDFFGLLVERYWNKLFAYVRRTSYFSKEDIEDVLQEAFIKIYRFLNSYDDSMTFSTWAYQITRNCMIDEIRKKKARPIVAQLEDEELLKVLKSSLNIEREFAANDSLEKVKNLINEMPDNYREVLILRFLEDKDYNEIMDIMQLPKGSVASLINRGRKLLIEKACEKGINNC